MTKLTLLLFLIWSFTTSAKSDFELVKILNIGSSVNKSAKSEKLNYVLESSKEISTAELLNFIIRQTTKHNIGHSSSIPHKQKVKTNKFRFWGEVFTDKGDRQFAIFMLAPQSREKEVTVESTSTRLNVSPVPLNNENQHSFKLPWGKHLILRKNYTFNNELVGKKNGVFFQSKNNPFLVGALIQVKNLGSNANDFGRQFFKYLK